MAEKKDRLEIEVDKNKEMRTKGISKMIGEGGLGAEKYYDIKKTSSDKNKEDSKKDEE